MNTTIFSATTIGIHAHLVEIEVDLSFGMLQFHIVGLPDRAINESKQRIQTALKNSGIRLPERKITVNLAPADLKKEGTLFDLPIALGILQAGKFIHTSHQFLSETLFIGELSLDGSIRPIKGALAIAYDAKKYNKKRIILPALNAPEASLIEDIEIIGVKTLPELIGYLRNELLIAPTTSTYHDFMQKHISHEIDFSQVKGQHQAKRALQITAAGRHNILFIGPPGSGKTMLAQRLATIMPPMLFDEMIETTKIYSISGKLQSMPLVTQRPFRNPHHTISQVGLVGGGSMPKPGEISLSHCGILFLDELTEFKKTTLEVLRQPLEEGTVSISRASYSVDFPASFILVAALNPCPCGFFGDKNKRCHCSVQNIKQYISKISGPLLDRIDLHVNVQSVDYETVKQSSAIHSQSSADLMIGIQKAVNMQHQRFGNHTQWNADMNTEQIERYCILSADAELLIKKAFAQLNLSMRGYHKILKIARTIADLDASSEISTTHLQEAIMYRSLENILKS